MSTTDLQSDDRLNDDVWMSNQTETLVHVDELHFYGNAPRQLPNPRYQELFNSIELHGVDQPFVIGKRPGEEHFTLLAGGGTRLQILKSLHADTGEDKYALARCVKKEWPGEVEATLMYLRADELHGDLTFVERSSAVLELLGRRAEERGKDSFTHRHAARELSELGYTISYQHFSSMDYAVNRLLPLLPKALRGGLGRHSVDKIRTLENTSRRMWREFSDNNFPFDELFEEHCKRTDDEQWSTDLLQMELEDEIAIGCGRDLHWVRMMLDRALNGEKVDFELDIPPLILPEVASAKSRLTTEPSTVGRELDDVNSVESDVEIESSEEKVDKPGRNPYLKELRAYACGRALSLGARAGIEDCIARAFGSHCGFYLVDIPVDRDDDKACAVWEFLAVVSAMSEASLHHWKELVPEHARLRIGIEAVREDVAEALVGLHLDRLDSNTWFRLDDEEWADAMGLMDVYRKIRMELRNKGWQIWPKEQENNT